MHLCHGTLLIFLAESILYLLVLQSILGMFIARLIVWLISWPIELVFIRLVNGFWANGDLPKWFVWDSSFGCSWDYACSEINFSRSDILLVFYGHFCLYILLGFLLEILVLSPSLVHFLLFILQVKVQSNLPPFIYIFGSSFGLSLTQPWKCFNHWA